MFVVTARLPRRKLLTGGITVLCCCAVVAAALVLTLGDRVVTVSAEVSGLRNNEERIAYLNGLGWEVSDSPVMIEELLVPETFDESYTEYLTLQSSQGFDLTKYAGRRIKRYTYTVSNYPDDTAEVQAALLIYKGRIIGGQLQAADGSFVLPLTEAEA